MGDQPEESNRTPSRVFFAFPSEPHDVGTTIQAAVEKVTGGKDGHLVQPWPELAVAGRFIGTTVLDAVASAGVLAADISLLNFNVTYEIGYAIGCGKPVLLVRHAAIAERSPTPVEVGVFDTIGYSRYQNSDELASFLLRSAPSRPLLTPVPVNTKAPVYLLESKYKTDWAIRIAARIKKARLSFRSFDPAEQPRLSAYDALRQVAQSHGAFLYLLPSHHEDAGVHNQRAAFIAGLAHGMGKVLSLIQFGDEPVPLDYRDLVVSVKHPEQIDEAVQDFASRVAEALQADFAAPTPAPKTILAQLTLGASTAENEMKELSSYYLETDAFQRAVRGEVRLVVGRKGSGKTALFLSLRDAVRVNRDNVVLDLKPEGYKLVKFKEAVLDLLSLGTVEHTITAFWEYLLLLELCHKLLEKDRERHVRDHTLYEAYRRLAGTYVTDRYVAEGDFAERMTTLLEEISQDYHSRYGGAKPARLSDPEITALLYRHNVSDLASAVVDYLRHKKVVWLLFDNIDKGWPPHGLKPEDMLIIRTLIDATRKLERQLHAHGVESRTVVFLRNDIYELLIDQTPDRGKETRALLDWTDADMLRELVRRRVASGLRAPEASFEHLWRAICVSHIEGEETSQYLIERCLMRPRYLIDILSQCRGFAVNLHHERIEQEDIQKALGTYSTDLLTDIGYEIRDVLPDAENAVYAFIESPPRLPEAEVRRTLCAAGVAEGDVQGIVRILSWYGFLGLARGVDQVTYIHSTEVNYSMLLFEAIRKKVAAGGEVEYAINPAFWPSLTIRA